jgi:hypothetical protein
LLAQQDLDTVSATPQVWCCVRSLVFSEKLFLDPGTRLSADQAPATAEDKAFMLTVPDVSAVGMLLYLAIATRPDIAYSVGVLCRVMAKPGLRTGRRLSTSSATFAKCVITG